MRQIYYSFRILLRGRGSNIVKLLSLSLGLLIGVLLFSQIAFELSYENFYKDADRVAILQIRWVKGGIPDKDLDDTAHRPAASDLSGALPQWVESGCVAMKMMQYSFSLNGYEVEGTDMIGADTLFFSTVGIEVLQGDVHDLATRNVIFLSESMARKLFPDENPIGKILTANESQEMTVRGVYRDLQPNTEYYHNIVVSLPTVEWSKGTWNNNDIYHIFFRMRHVEDIEAMNGSLERTIRLFNDYDRNRDFCPEYVLTPLSKVHLSNSDNRRRLIILAVLGFSVFFISIMNYVLAAIASLGNRAKVVGVNKCCGAGNGQVMGMFLWETGIVVLGAIVVSALLLYLFGRNIEEMMQVKLSEIFCPDNLWVAALTVLLLFLVAGILPGRIFAHIPVTQVFRHYTDGKRGWKCGLLFVQFVGVAFILGMLLTVVGQYHTIINTDLGFRSEGLANLRLSVKNLNERQNVCEALRHQPYVEGVSCASNRILSHYNTTGLGTHYMRMEKEYPQLMGMQLIEGDWPEKEGDILVGETTVKELKIAQPVVGQRCPGLDEGENPGIIVGVVKDVRNMGFASKMKSTAFICHGDVLWMNDVNVRLKEPYEENLKKLKAFYSELRPTDKNQFASFKEIREIRGRSVYRFQNTAFVTSVCVLFIVLMGLLGYVNNETGRRSKEIAIRKVNGAVAADILHLLSADILKVAVGAVVLGIISSWYISGIWMEQFPDSELLSPLWFVLLGICLLALIVLVVVIKAWRIANENPVKSIKSE